MLKPNQVYHGDCLEVMNQIDDKSIDMILCDLPYGTTACKWDVIIPFEPLWQHYKRIIKYNGAIVLTATEPFASYLRMSNIKWYKYDWVWDKVTAGGLLARYRPVMTHEYILLFCKTTPFYNPIKTPRSNPLRQKIRQSSKSAPISHNDGKWRIYNYKNPKSILIFHNRNGGGKLHATQKPVKLFEYLIRTYTNENDLVLDNCAGSGTTGVACRNLNRDFILIEKEEEYVEIIKERLSEPHQERLFV